MFKPSVKAMVVRTAGITLVGMGLYLVIISSDMDGEGILYSTARSPGDDFIDAEWREMD